MTRPFQRARPDRRGALFRALASFRERLRQRSSPTLGSRLSWLVLGSLLPMVLLLFATFVANYRAARESAAQQVQDVARGTALALEGELRTTIISLEALSLSPSLANGDLEGFRHEADMLAKKNFPGASVALLNLDGQQFFNTFRPPGSPLPRRPDREALERVKATRQPAVSDLFFAPLQQAYIVPVDVPVFAADGQIWAALSLAPPLRTFAQMVERQHVPSNWLVSVLDRKAVIVARTRDADQFIGQPAMEAFRQLLQQHAEGTADVVARDGTMLLAGWSRPGPSGWSVAIGIPQDEFFAAQRNALAAALAVSALTAAGALLLARFVAGRIARPVQALTQLAERSAAAQGEVPIASSLGLREVDAVAAALIQAMQERKAAQGQLHAVEASSRAELERQVAERTAELQAAQAQLLKSQRMEAVGQLTAGVAHDFNNLLQVQVSGLELLHREVRGQERATRYAEAALASSAKAAQLTHSLLSFSRQQMLRPEAVDIPALLDRLHALLSRTLDPRIALQIDVGVGMASPMADPAQLEAALLNLCLNARDGMEGRTGRLWVKAENGVTVPADAPEGLDPAKFIVLTVEDEGCGMDAATLARVCEPFFTTKVVGKGSGLGLSMVQGFVRQSGGELRIQSWPGVGTRVEVWLPQAAAPPAAIAASPAAATMVRGIGRVLVVDDETQVRELVGEVLQDAGFEVVQTGTGEEALQLVHASAGFDALVTDYAMPGMTGVELVAQVRLLRPHLPALIITGYAEIAQLGTVPRGVEMLQKPFRLDEVAALVAGLIETAGDGAQGRN